jgi:Lipid-droplet associated hydrolase
MAADEMRDISNDKWSDEVWGTASSGSRLPNLIFYFGRNDHWVAERTRNKIIATRGVHGGPKLIVCEDGLPHAFCISEFLEILIPSLQRSLQIAIERLKTRRLTWYLSAGHSNIMARKAARFVEDIMASWG